NIERAIKKAAGADTDSFESMRYEGYGPGGVAIIVETLTDNRNRTGGGGRGPFSKYGGHLGAPRAVARQFARVRGNSYQGGAGSADAVLEAAIEAGAEDVQSSPAGHLITTTFADLGSVSDALEAKLGEPATVKALWKPVQTTSLDEDKAAALLKLIAGL